MLYDELQQHFGSHIAKRVQSSLTRMEFQKVDVDKLRSYLEARAEASANCYKKLMDNPLERGNVRCEILHKQWSDAEDLVYLISVAEDVSLRVRATMAGA